MTESENPSSAERPVWAVVVVYEDDSLKSEAINFCDAFVERFWHDCELDVNWWSFNLLRDQTDARQACAEAVAADLILFAARPGRDLPPEIQFWVDSWAIARGDREGTLIGLLDPAQTEHYSSPPYIFLRNIAHHAGMDYLTEMPESISLGTPDSLDSVTERAGRVTGVLDEILHHQIAPRAL